jgi:hypothetical protein
MLKVHPFLVAVLLCRADVTSGAAELIAGAAAHGALILVDNTVAGITRGNGPTKIASF